MEFGVEAQCDLKGEIDCTKPFGFFQGICWELQPREHYYCWDDYSMDHLMSSHREVATCGIYMCGIIKPY